jgi:hypothetical protein
MHHNKSLFEYYLFAYSIPHMQDMEEDPSHSERLKGHGEVSFLKVGTNLFSAF